MMYKNVLTHQPNLVDPYELGRPHAPRLPHLPGEAHHHDRHPKAYPRGHQWPTDQDPTSHRSPHGTSGSPPYLGPDSPQKAATGSAHK
jgi:hypothetical protein